MKKVKKIKLPGLFKKKYTAKKYQKKILKKLFIPADRALVESLAVESKDKKGKPVYTFDAAKVQDSAQAKKLKKIAKEIKKQKSRLKVLDIIVAAACVAVLLFGITLFRNVIAHRLITGAFEGTFGAKCDIGLVDFNLFDTRFTMENLAQANRSKPMTNLFEVARLDVYFNLLELTRGKLVSENLEITGIRWGTDRTESGTLPPKQEKKYQKKKEQEDSKPNPVVAALSSEVKKIQSGISLDSGISAIQDKLDPVAFLEREKDSLLSPKIVEEITGSVPAMIDSWKDSSENAEKQVTTMVATAKNISKIDPRNIKTVEEIKRTITELDAAKKTMESTVSMAKDLSTKIESDRKQVLDLSSRAREAVAADSKRLTGLVNEIKTINLDTGKGIVGDIFRTFIVNTLGEYYPYLDRGLAMLGEMQASQKKEKKPTLKQKASVVDRLPGRNISFGDDSLPSLVFRNIALSAEDVKTGFTIGGSVQNLTNDADRLDKAVTASLGTTHGAMSEALEAVIDLRTGASDILDSDITAGGYTVSIPSAGVQGVPDVAGVLSTEGELRIAADRALSIQTAMTLGSAQLTVAPFKPAFIHTTYRNVLSRVNTIDFDVSVHISSSGSFDVDVSTGIDEVLYEALQDEIDRQIALLKEDIRKEVEKFINEQKQKYTSEITQFTAIYDRVKNADKEIRKYENVIDQKKAELENRIKDMAQEQIDKVKQEAQEQAEKAKKEAEEQAKKEAEKKAAPLKKDAEDRLKKLF